MYWVPIHTDSNQGTHITGRDVKEWAEAQEILWTFHLPYNPTATGLVERMNRLLKETLKKLSPDGSLRGCSPPLLEAIWLLNTEPTAGHMSAYERLTVPALPTRALKVQVLEGGLRPI